eukprot:s378_g27.t1
MMIHSGDWLRAKPKRMALPIREGELAGLREKLACLTLPEVVTEDFSQQHAEACWCYLACYACNFLCGVVSPLRAGIWTAAERQVGEAVRSMAKRLLSHRHGEAVDVSAVEKDLKLARVDYTGEEVGTCHKLTLRQISPALPPADHGGSIELINYVSPVSQKFLLDPELCILPDTGQELPKLQGKIHVEQGELDLVTKALVDCGVCTWIPLKEVLTFRNQPVLNGLFGVPKPSKLDTGEPVLRVIMNLVASNSVMLQLQGQVQSLPNITAWMSTVGEGDDKVKIWQSDMSNAFYLFRLPQQWHRCLAFNVVRSGKDLGLSPDIDYAMACCVLPMGWLSSVSIMQEVSENLLFQQSFPVESQISRHRPLPVWMVGLLQQSKREQRAWWHVYLDNYAGGQLVGPDEDATLGDQLHEWAEEAWKKANVMSAEKKRKRAVSEAEELGALVDGNTMTIGASPQRLLRVIHATLWVLSRPQLSKKHIQVLAGRWVHILQFRRPGMSFLEATWEFVGSKKFSSSLVLKVRRELWMCICATPLLHTNLKAVVSGFTTASDASSTGGAIGISRQLSDSGKDYVESQLRHPSSLANIPVLVISLFHGIGGSFRCYDILGLRPMGLISFEINPDANRISARRWPHSQQLGDVRSIDRNMIRDWLLRYNRITEIHLWAGFPCTDLSSVKAFREGLQGDQSRLFYEVPRVLTLLREECGSVIQVKFTGENVASMGKDECCEISTVLNVWPYHLNCADAVPVNRPRLCWCSEPLEDVFEGVTFDEEEYWSKVTAPAAYPDIAQWLEPGATWPGQHEATFPTSLRAIVRKRPPPKPAGLQRCDPDTLSRWESECFKFPPYQFPCPLEDASPFG